MKRVATSSIAAAILLFGAGVIAANADETKPPVATPATTCMNCK